MDKNFKITAPATSANLGAGLDCLGAALTLYNETEFFFTEKEFEIFPSALDAPRDKTNLVFSSMAAVFELCGKKLENVGFRQKDAIPLAGGLGSSAACIVTGVCAADYLLDRPLCEREIIRLCSSLDGHPDNVLPCLKGGLTACLNTEKEVKYLSGRISGDIFFVAATPYYGLKTADARKVLPDSYSRKDVLYSMQRAVAAFGAFQSGDFNILAEIGDKLHTPYRKPLIKDFDRAERAMKEAGAAAVYLSGSGPTLMGLFKKETLLKIDGFTVRSLKADREGLKICPVV